MKMVLPNNNFPTFDACQNLIKNKIISNFDNILKEDNYLQQILLPNIKGPITKKKDEIYYFPNNESFKGIIVNGHLEKGEYSWPNGQKFIGYLSPNNIFNKKGKIIFPDKKGVLTGFFKFSNHEIKGENNIIEKAIYETNKRKYEGSFKNNKLHGKFVINNTQGSPHYLYKGNYYNGVKHGRFILEVMRYNKKIKITGTFEKGIKNGVFKVFILNGSGSSVQEELISEIKFENDFLIMPIMPSNLIENKLSFNNKVKYNIYCMELFDYDNKLILLLGSSKYLLIYSIDITDNKIYPEKKIIIFKNANINDILYINNYNLIMQ